MNYATLVSTIQAYVENDFPTTPGTGGLTSTQQINTFIQEAEQRIYSAVQLLNLRKSATITMVANNKALSTPADWLATFEFAVIDPTTGQHDFLLNKDVNFIREAFPIPTATGKPTHYAMSDATSFLLGPTPDQAYTGELHYFYYPPSIVTAGTSWLGDNFDSALLYGSLLEAGTFMKGEADVLAGYQKRYEEAITLLIMFAEGKNRQDMYRTPQARYPVR
jgi:hypothetical protein